MGTNLDPGQATMFFDPIKPTKPTSELLALASEVIGDELLAGNALRHACLDFPELLSPMMSRCTHCHIIQWSDPPRVA